MILSGPYFGNDKEKLGRWSVVPTKKITRYLAPAGSSSHLSRWHRLDQRAQQFFDRLRSWKDLRGIRLQHHNRAAVRNPLHETILGLSSWCRTIDGNNVTSTIITAEGRIWCSPSLESMRSMQHIAGDHEDRPHDSMSDIGRIGHNDLPPMKKGH